MAKHLTEPLKQKIVEAIKIWQNPLDPDAKITWSIVEKLAETITGEKRTRQSLNKQPEIKKAYEERATGTVAEKSKKDIRIERLEKEVKKLQKENALLVEKFLRWAYNAKNATKGPVEIEDLERPLPNPERVRT